MRMATRGSNIGGAARPISGRPHRAGQYLSQPFARNLVYSPGRGIGAIDFEDDPITVMPLVQAQIRDWIPYFFSTAIYFPERLPRLCAAFGETLADEETAVREGVATLLRRTAWLRVLRWMPRRLQRRDVLKTRYFGELAHLCSRHGLSRRSSDCACRARPFARLRRPEFA